MYCKGFYIYFVIPNKFEKKNLMIKKLLQINEIVT